MATATQEFTVTFPADPDHSFLLFAVRLEAVSVIAAS